jgi:hypothetical protein
LTLSLLESLTQLPAPTREAILAILTEEQAEQLQYDWSFYARPNQLLPPGNWLTWLLLAGRGFGKTRAAAEAVRALVCGPTPLAGTEYGQLPFRLRLARVFFLAETSLVSIGPPSFPTCSLTLVSFQPMRREVHHWQARSHGEKGQPSITILPVKTGAL